MKTKLKLLKFTIPTISMMVFTSLYTLVDGFFVANFISENALASLNIVYPFIGIIIGIGVMIGTGASSQIAKQIGEGKEEKAKQSFSLIMVFSLILGIIISIISFIFLEQILKLLQTTELLYSDAKIYLKIIIIFIPFQIIQMIYGILFSTASKPNIGFIFILFSGILNIILDYIFVKELQMGIAGAAYATIIGYIFTTIGSTLYFFLNKSTFSFTKFKIDFHLIFLSLYNGSSEMLTNIATSIVNFIFNIQMLHFFKEDGVSAISAVLYISFLFSSIFMGFSNGVAPLISMEYGKKNRKGLKIIIKNSLILTGIFSIIMFTLAILLKNITLNIFLEYDSKAYLIASEGYMIFTFSYLLCGFNIFSSALFTALSNGKISFLISLLRTLVFTVINIVVLTILFKVLGLWLAVPVAEFMCLLICIVLFKIHLPKYLKNRLNDE